MEIIHYDTLWGTVSNSGLLLADGNDDVRYVTVRLLLAFRILRNEHNYKINEGT